MNGLPVPASLAAALIVSSLTVSPSMSDTMAPPFQADVDMNTFIEHVLTPAMQIIWSVNGSMIDDEDEHDLRRKPVTRTLLGALA